MKVSQGLASVGTCAAVLLLTATVHAATWDAPHPILSALYDTSGIEQSLTAYSVSLSKSAAEGDLYINEINLIPTAYDEAIGLSPASATLWHDGAVYTLGAPITGDVNWTLESVVWREGDVDPSVAAGVHDFDIQFIGGNSASATDELARLAMQIEVFPSLSITASAIAVPSVIRRGEQTTIVATMTNDMGDRNFVTTIWYTSVAGMVQFESTLDLVGFAGDWFNKTIAPGESRTDEHTIWSAPATGFLPLGDYYGNMGIIGGLYNGDGFSFALSPVVTVIPIPEPACLSLCVLGLLAGFGRPMRSGRCRNV